MKRYRVYACRAGYLSRLWTRTTVRGVVIALMGTVLAACGGYQHPSETTTTTTTTTTQTGSLVPTEQQAINPSGPNSFTPTVLAPPAPTEPPGVHRNY
jgi:hypothetical protein